jgi:hypothetical protein
MKKLYFDIIFGAASAKKKGEKGTLSKKTTLKMDAYAKLFSAFPGLFSLKKQREKIKIGANPH